MKNDLRGFEEYAAQADYIDPKVFEGDASLRDFVIRMIAYKPTWLKILYKVRKGMARVLGLQHDESLHVVKDDQQLLVGENVSFFKTVKAEEDIWVGEGADKHLTAWFCVRKEPLTNHRSRFHLITIVRYNNWMGRVYLYPVIPFHHLVVNRMAKYALKPAS